MKHQIVKSVLALSILLALLWLAFEGIARYRDPRVIKIKHIEKVGSMEVNGLQMTCAEITAFCEKTNLSKLRCVKLIGFEHSTAGQIRRTYNLFSEQGYNDKLTLIFFHQKIPVWIYPMEDHHHELSSNQTKVLDVLVEGEGFRIGGTIREIVEYPTNGIPRIIYGGIRERIFDSVVYRKPEDVLEIVGFCDISKDIPIEILCEESVSCLPVLQALRALSALGFDKLYLTFY